MLYSLAQDQSTRGRTGNETSGGDGEGGGCWTFPAKEDENQEGRSQNCRALRVRIEHSLRTCLLKRQCVLNIINILISTTISLMTRDIIVKFLDNFAKRNVQRVSNL